MYDSLLSSIPPKFQHSILLACEKGFSSWLTTLPLVNQGYALHKGAFRDALCLCYGGSLNCYHFIVCGKTIPVEQAPFGDFPSIRHNELCDITVAFLSEVCHNVDIEPNLQPLSGKQFCYRSANVEDGARLDINA